MACPSSVHHVTSDNHRDRDIESLFGCQLPRLWPTAMAGEFISWASSRQQQPACMSPSRASRPNAQISTIIKNHHVRVDEEKAKPSDQELAFSDLPDEPNRAAGSRRKKNEPADMDNTGRSGKSISFAVDSVDRDGPGLGGRDRRHEHAGLSASLTVSEMLHRASIAAHKMSVDYEKDQPAKGGGLFSFSGVAVRRRRIAKENNPKRTINRRQALVAQRYSMRSLRRVADDSDGILRATMETIGVQDDGLSAPLCAALFINLISIGYLSLPWAFNAAGTVLSTIGFGLVMHQAFITAQYVLEACARSHALASATENMEMTASIRDTSMQAVYELATIEKLDLDNLDDSNHSFQDMHLMEQAREDKIDDEDRQEPTP